MEESASGLVAKQMAGYSRSGIFPALVLLLTVPLAAFISESFPVNGLPELASRSNAMSFGGQDLIWAQLGVAVAMVIVFYELGKRIDFSSHYRMLTVLAFAGAVIGNLPGFYLYTTRFFGGYVWQSGFGYVQSFGYPEPTSIMDLLTSAVSAFMIPLAGLALAYFRFQRIPAYDSQAELIARRKSRFPLPYFLITLAIALLAFPVTDITERIVFAQLPLPSQTLNLVGQIPVYDGFLVYPVLFLIALYVTGRRFDPSESGLTRFGLALFIGAVIGLFLSLFLGAYISNPSTISSFVSRVNLSDTLSFLVWNGISVAILGFSAASLGFVAVHSKQNQTTTLR